jgi:hypothetical protein
VRQSGGTIWLEPAIRSIYFSRDDLAGLARQYWRYGYWKARMLSRYPESLRWRQALPPFFVLTLFVGLLGSFWVPAIRWVFVLELTAYILVLLLAGIQRGIKHRDMALIFGVPLAIATMHLTWGSAFLWSLMFK